MPRIFNNATELRDRLRLEPHPEGGYFRETYRSETTLLHPRTGNRRATVTSIYFYLDVGNFSAWHSVRSDEVWTWVAGGPLELHRIDRPGTYGFQRLGPLIEGYQQQAVIPAGDWQAARPVPGTDWALVSCVVAPGFDFDDFHLPTAAELLERYPEHREIILELTRGPEP